MVGILGRRRGGIDGLTAVSVRLCVRIDSLSDSTVILGLRPTFMAANGERRLVGI